jgi:hypothetical protein
MIPPANPLKRAVLVPSPQDGAPSSSNDDPNVDSNDSNESSSDTGIRDNDSNNGYSSETQYPMGSTPTEGTSTDDSNDPSSGENNNQGAAAGGREKRKHVSMATSSQDESSNGEFSSSIATNSGSHKYRPQQSGVSSSGSSKTMRLPPTVFLSWRTTIERCA